MVERRLERERESPSKEQIGTFTYLQGNVSRLKSVFSAKESASLSEGPRRLKDLKSKTPTIENIDRDMRSTLEQEGGPLGQQPSSSLSRDLSPLAQSNLGTYSCFTRASPSPTHFSEPSSPNEGQMQNSSGAQNSAKSTTNRALVRSSPESEERYIEPAAPRHNRFLSFSTDETGQPVSALPSEPVYKVRVDFDLPSRESIHVPDMLSSAIDTLLKVTGNKDMSASKVEEQVKAEVMKLHESEPQECDSPNQDFLDSATGQNKSDAKTCSFGPRGSLHTDSSSTVCPSPSVQERDRASSTPAQGSPYRPPSVHSLPNNCHTTAELECHCPFCCSCGSYKKRFLGKAHNSLFQRSPSTQSVPAMYVDGGVKARECPLQRFRYVGDGLRQDRLRDSRQPHSASMEGASLARASVRELTQSFEVLAGNQSISTSQLSLPSVTLHGSYHGDTTFCRTPFLSAEHYQSPSLTSFSIREESLPLRVAGNWSSGAAHHRELSIGSMTSLNSQRTYHSQDLSYYNVYHGHSMRVGVDGGIFKERIETLLGWFKEFSDQQRNLLLSRLLDCCNSAQMHHLSLQMEPILHLQCPHNCQDILSWLPPTISFKILSLLDPGSLCFCLRVSKNWYRLATDERLWQNLCRVKQYQLSHDGQRKLMEIYSRDGHIQWKEMFAESYRLCRNWARGYCNIRTFEGHTQGVSCVQFDENRIVSGSSDKTIKVWNIRTNTPWAALTLEGHSGDVRCLHLFGNRLVSGSSDRTIKVWELFTENVSWLGATCRVTMQGHAHTVRCLQSDDKNVISGSYDHTLKIWDITSGECRHTLRGHTNHVLCLQFRDDRLLSGSGDCTIRVWDLNTFEMKLILRGHKAAVTTLQFDESRIISGSLDHLIKIWDIATGACVNTLDWIRSEGHTGVVRHLQANRWKMVSAADDKTLKVWSLESGERLLTLRSHTDGVTCVQFNDKVIVSGSYDRTVKLWDFSAP